mmetsp:Transcript_72848/g.194445  ORF Transcript_72848/g.194445 Transcript_72848/m.194445 type:complete len:200 (-) Transcript_72848:466-1065(-)
MGPGGGAALGDPPSVHVIRAPPQPRRRGGIHVVPHPVQITPLDPPSFIRHLDCHVLIPVDDPHPNMGEQTVAEPPVPVPVDGGFQGVLQDLHQHVEEVHGNVGQNLVLVSFHNHLRRLHHVVPAQAHSILGRRLAHLHRVHLLLDNPAKPLLVLPGVQVVLHQEPHPDPGHEEVVEHSVDLGLDDVVALPQLHAQVVHA